MSQITIFLKNQIYLDYAATTPMAPEAVAAMVQCLTIDGEFANPASLQHEFGERAYLYALHRMQAAKMLEQDCRHKPAFNLANFAAKQGHFGSGVTIHFKARISDHLTLMLEETRLSENQTISPADDSGFREITADVSDTWLLRWWILGECDRIEVIEPEDLRRQIAESLSKCHQFYLNAG